MLSIAVLIALVAFAVMVATTATWFKRIQQVAIPDNRLGFLGMWLLAALLGGGSFFLPEAGLLSGIFGTLAVLVGAGFLVLYALGKQGEDHPIIVGDNMPAFTAFDDTKSLYDSSVLDGSPVLIKFFRGHW